MTVSLEPFLHLAAALLALGIYGLLTRRNAVSAIASLQIITHATVIAIVVFGRGWDHQAASSATLHPGGASPGFADAFGTLIVILLVIQTVVALSLVRHQQLGREASGDVSPAGAEAER